MGARGPVGKRADQRHGHRSKAEKAAVDKAPGGARAEAPAADEKWHPVAKMWFESLAKSGQSAFYEASDWATAYAVAESMSREFKPQPLVVGSKGESEVEWVEQPPKGASLAAWLKAMSSLMVTEGDRRRLRLELSTPKREEASDVSELDEYRARLRSGSAG